MGMIICAGLGPGDPELMSVRADRTVRSAKHVAFFRKRGRTGNARAIVDGMLADGCVEHPMEYPLTTELPFDDPRYISALANFYDRWADRLSELAQSSDVVVLCEGDPFFYGSFMHLFIRLEGKCQIDVIPGITGMSGCWTQAGKPFTWGDDVCTVLMGTLPEGDLERHMAKSEAIVVMKTGRNLAKVRRALAAAHRLDDAWLVERGTMAGQRVMRLRDCEAAECPYFATVLVAGNGRRPMIAL
ncbi:MAG: precorrin-2 C(20)-methyltransferase [Pseudomonadota bacterium]